MLRDEDKACVGVVFRHSFRAFRIAMRLSLIAQMNNRSLGAGRIVPRESGLSEHGTMRPAPRRSAVVPIWG